jgi:hypothetical protein
METKPIAPNLYRLYSLSVIYHVQLDDILRMYDINLANVPDDLGFASIPATHLTNALDKQEQLDIPVRLDPGFDERYSSPIVRMIQRWGTFPLHMLKKFTNRRFTYGYVGHEDWTMYPLIMPGAFIQIDEGKRKVAEGPWRSEYERPIYFVEMRDGFTCCWCEVIGSILTLKSHPLSPVKTRLVKMGSEAEIIGQVVGVAMQLEKRLAPPEPKGR